MEAIGLWFLGQAVIPDAYSRFLSSVRDKSSLVRLTRAVHADTGIRPGRRYKRWLRQETTWRHLVAHGSDDYEQLIDTLAMAEAHRLLRRRSVNRERATKLVNATIVYFLPSLDPSMATAVADTRADRRHAELMARFDAATSYEERLSMLPPPARRVLEQEDVPHGQAVRLVDAVLRNEPRSIVASLAEVPPNWLEDASATIYLALAEIALAYGAHLQAGQFFEHVADLGHDRPRCYAKAAYMYVLAGQPERRPKLIEKARTSGVDPMVDAVEAALDSSSDRVLNAIDLETASSDPFAAQIYATALHDQRGRDATIAFLSELVEREPLWAGIALLLAQLLLQRSTEAGTTSRARDLELAEQIALHARDVRRQWRGNSREAAVVACHAALIAGNPQEVMRIGMTEPDGTASPEEAAEPEVQFYVAQAAMSVGDHETAERAAAAVSGFRRELIKADLLAASDAAEAELAEQYQRAWALADTESEQVDLWLSASMAGLEPLPGSDQLAHRTDDLPMVTAALQHLARHRYQQAVDLLRPNRQNERARSLLVRANVGLGEIDQAVAELKDMATRFDNAGHLVNAVHLLVEADRLSDAAELADRTLTLIGNARPERAFLHEVGVAAASHAGDWPNMETRSRAWIDDCGLADNRAWALATSLYHQGETETAWRITQERGDLEPQTAHHAQLWIALHTEYEPSPGVLSKALALSDRFRDDPGVRARAVNAFLLMGRDAEDIDAVELARWRTLIRDRAAKPGPGDTFHQIDVPDDAEALSNTLRPFLEPRAIQIKEWITKVRKDGWPYGVVAEAAGGYYTSALVHRAAGFHPIASADPHVLSREREGAIGALNGDVIADLSVLAIAWYIKDRWHHLVGAFETVRLTPDAKTDCTASLADLRPRATTVLGWDVRTGRPVLHETPREQLDRLEQHLTWVRTIAFTLSTHTQAANNEQEAARPGAWMSAFQAAKTTNLALWADDVGLRTLARNEGVVTFGTDSLLHALASQGKLTTNDLVATTYALRDEYCVDLPLDPQWLTASARRDNWHAGPAALTFARPPAWVIIQQGLHHWRQVATQAGNADPKNVPVWVHAASTGITQSTTPHLAQELVGILLTIAAGATQFDAKAFADCVNAAKAACEEMGVPNPAELAFKKIFNMLVQGQDSGAAATALARLGSELIGDEQVTLRRILFNL